MKRGSRAAGAGPGDPPLRLPGRRSYGPRSRPSDRTSFCASRLIERVLASGRRVVRFQVATYCDIADEVLCCNCGGGEIAQPARGERSAMVKRISHRDASCPIARPLDAIGDWWSLLIIRDVFDGRHRFGEFQKNLGLAKNILSARLRNLVEHGILDTV